MLIVLMYHRARHGRHGNSPQVLDAHFAHIASSCETVMPGEPLSRGGLNVCLSFDDAYFDFYAVVFPLLVKHKLRALLAVPPGYTEESVTPSWEQRLDVSAEKAFRDPRLGGFCTWPELEELSRSGHVEIAAHGYSHRRLDLGNADLTGEIDSPQSILAERLNRPVNSFVFPFGRCSAGSMRRAKARYPHVFRIGGALNYSWAGRILYRVEADETPDPKELFVRHRLMRCRLRNIWNRLRWR